MTPEQLASFRERVNEAGMDAETVYRAIVDAPEDLGIERRAPGSRLPGATSSATYMT